MSVYSVRGFTAATGTADPKAVFQLWNPDAADEIRVLELGLTVSTDNLNARWSILLLRSTARGTPGSTITPDADNAWDNQAAPPSGALLDLAAFSADPTAGGPELWGCNISGGALTNTRGTGFTWTSERGLIVPPGAGLLVRATVGGVNAFQASEVYAVWEENS